MSCVDDIYEKYTNKDIIEKLLKITKNETTKIVIYEDIKGNYYTFFNNTIYIGKGIQNIKYKFEDKVNSLIVMAHEVIHSTQNKKIHILNFVFSNIYFLCVALSFIISLFFNNVDSSIFIIICFISLFFSLFFRQYLELDAIINSEKLFLKFLDNESVNLKENEKKIVNKNIKIAAVLSFFTNSYKKIILFFIMCLFIKFI